MAKKTRTLAVAFAENLRVERARQKISQADLAEACGYSTSMISMMERGQRVPPLDGIERIAKALKITPVELLA